MPVEKYPKTRPPYTQVHLDGDKAVAVDSRGERIAESTDHTSVIQTAIDHLANKGGGIVKVLYDQYSISKQIRVKGNVELDLSWAIVKPLDDFDIFYIKENARLRRVVADLRDIATFTSAVVKVHGVENIGINHKTIVEKVRCLSDGKGTVVHLLCENANEYITFISVRDVQASNIEYGIRIQLTNTEASAWINGNNFENIILTNPKYGIYLERNTSLSPAESACNHNVFRDIRIQAGNNTSKAIRIQGVGNVVIAKVWDMSVAPEGALALDLDADSRHTYCLGAFGEAYIQDNGADNIIIDEDSGTIFTNFIFKKFGSQRYMEITDSHLRLSSPSDVNPLHIIVEPPSDQVSDGTWAYVVRVQGETYPRFQVGTTGTIRLSDGANPPNAIISNVGGKARLQNVESIQIPYTESLPAEGNFKGDIRLYYDGTYYYIAIWNGSAWVKVQLS